MKQFIAVALCLVAILATPGNGIPTLGLPAAPPCSGNILDPAINLAKQAVNSVFGSPLGGQTGFPVNGVGNPASQCAGTVGSGTVVATAAANSVVKTAPGAAGAGGAAAGAGAAFGAL